MSQRLETVQVQGERQLQKLTPLQLLNVQLVEMSIADLEQRVKDELDSNEALEEGGDNQEDIYDDNPSDEYNDDGNVDELYGDGYDQPINSLTGLEAGNYAPDDIPAYLQNKMEDSDREQLSLSDTISFIDDLEAQMLDFDLDEHQTELVAYLIGSLNEKGFIEQDFYSICNEMLFNQGIETNEQELEEALHVLQQFEPAGIGARNYQECFLIQIDRKLIQKGLTESRVESLRLQRRIIADEYEAFQNRNIDRISDRLDIDKSLVQNAISEITKLNYNPGMSLSESSTDRAQVAIPDLIIETDGINDITFRLNNDSLPVFHVSEEYRELANQYQRLGNMMRERDRVQLAYCKEKYDKAQMFIDSINQRNHTLKVTMKAIVDFQRPFILSQNVLDLNNLVYKDIAERAKLDISTVSRVCQSKYVSIDGSIYPMSVFFKHNRKNSQGEEIDSDYVSMALEQIVVGEDKYNPYSDSQLVQELQKHGIKVARRTVASYRDRLAIPVASKRKR